MKKLFASALALAAGSLAQAQDVAQHIDINGITGERRGAQMIDEVVVPVPSEIFAVLDKQGQGKPAWSNVLRPMKEVVKPLGNQEQISLMLGIVIAEGFVAVEAEDTEAVKNIGRSVLSLSEPLAVKKAVTRRANAIIEAADKHNWALVRKELDGALFDVKTAMAQIRSQDLAQLVSLGGWLRGTEALTQVVEKTYTTEGSELLHQPVLLTYFKRRIEGMGAKNKDPLVAKVRQALTDIEPLMGTGETADVSEKTVRQIHSISAEVIKTINQKPTP